MFYQPRVTTAESVTSGHPDKICDQISDAILDECLSQDPKSRVAIETFGSNGNLLVIGGELTTNATVDYEKVARRVYKNIGYTNELKIITNIAKQSSDIAQGVDTGGAGDQGIMYGYATNKTKKYLPKAVVYAHQLTSGLEKLRKSGVAWLKPDGKAQVTIDKGRVTKILISTQHQEGVSSDDIKKFLVDELIKELIDDDNVEVLVNPTGKFVLGGFEADTGLTGRKIMVDTYGGLIPHGGGAFSGKDPTKVDRSAAYMCRFVAKNLVANGCAKECLVSVAYAIGKAEPLMVEAVDEKGKSLKRLVLKKFDFKPKTIIERLNLQRPIYSKTASYGHFGKEGLPWEEIVKI